MKTPIYIKTDHSLLSSLIKIDDLINYAKDNNINALALADDNLFGSIEFYDKCIKNNIKPIIGINVLNVILYAINYDGYKNLLKINTLNSKKELNLENLNLYKDNLICIVPYLERNNYNQFKMFEYLFQGFRNFDEARELKGELIYCNEILCLEEKEQVYLKYLYKIRDVDFIPNNNYLLNTFTYLNDDNNKLLTDLCNIVIPMRQNLIPVFCDDSFNYLRKLVKEGIKRVYKDTIPKVYLDRLEYELSVINKMGFNDYFLIVYDYVKYARENGVLVGPGRGSAAGSLVAYFLNITSIDPIKYNLLFERFLNPERISMPDIDIDFEYTRRDDIIKYCINKYGAKRVAPIMTFGTLSSKQVIRDVGRVMGVDIKIIDYLAKMIDSTKNLNDNYINIKDYINKFEELKKVYQIALKLEGLKRHTSIHAAGIVICKHDIDDIIPLEYHDNLYLTGITATYLEEIGLLKMDLLALKNLTLINDCLKELNINFDDIELDDKKALNIFNKVNTLGIFQFESTGMMNFLGKLKVTSFDDIVAGLALFRPGPMRNIDTYIKRKEGLASIEYLDEALIPILKETYGIIIYQEQIMLIANNLAKFTLAQADILRKAMSKKKESLLQKERQKFIDGCDSEEVGIKVYDLILKFAAYGFNKAHSVSYAMIAYKMAYIKAYYPSIFMKNLLSLVIGSEIKTKEYVNECKNNNINLVKPNVNLSSANYYVMNEKIVFPLTVIKNIGLSIANIIINERKNNKFIDIFDFISRCNVGEKILISLNKAGVLETLGYNQKTIDDNLDVIINYSSLGGLLEDTLKPSLVIKCEYNKQELMNREMEVLGFYLSDHPISYYRSKYKCIYLKEICNNYNKYIDCLILIEKTKKISTKNNKEMIFITGSDESGISEFILFPRNNEEVENGLYLVKGHVEKRFDKYQVIVNTLERLENF